MSKVVVSTLYAFTPIENPRALRGPLLDLMRQYRINGTVLLANEGINGTVAGSQVAIEELLSWLKSDPRLSALSHQESSTDAPPFLRRKVKLKNEIVTMGVRDVDPTESAGTRVAPKDWNALIDNPDVTLIDTRNEYEVRVGRFDGAVNPNTKNFREFPRYVSEHLDPAKHRKIAMYCTGGIRCEKSTAYLRMQGFEEVYQLDGGILNYLAEVPADASRWSGECFVFDERVTVDHALRKGHYAQCNACRMPVSDEERHNEHFVEGISCPHCFSKTTETQRRGFAERQRQIELARQRGETHVGSDIAEISQRRKYEKLEAKKLQRQDHSF